jgi:enoyl-CoA hydratase/carnithine racemase
MKEAKHGNGIGNVDVKTSNNIGVITLNNPEKRNSLCKELVDGLCAALRKIREQEVRVVILRAPAGAKVFFTRLPMNRLVEGRGFPPFRQKKGERMGHGTFWGILPNSFQL